ncbi:MAG: hypothetical protein Q8P18_14590 [Pseudomonadota bacterium]|nr:hypothetical protein [Pseudomonadota bacterium]
MLLRTSMLLLSACTASPVGTCALTREDATESCPVASCAIGCTSIEEGLRCCVETHGYGLEGDALAVLAADCEGAACDPDLYLTPIPSPSMGAQTAARPPTRRASGWRWTPGPASASSTAG